ncbi:hypothetical protein F511_39035 [Dorcoceras hygrometricum]|uniref:Uncharacterized protein n=1 Tax=Dorcoceras hygrometricum TaxID=472368 RepID=A0A2Z7D061_9LAMI|nr:hypothetical protein F511_39035 [Dorcoceras hygrometricum]
MEETLKNITQCQPNIMTIRLIETDPAEFRLPYRSTYVAASIFHHGGIAAIAARAAAEKDISSFNSSKVAAIAAQAAAENILNDDPVSPTHETYSEPEYPLNHSLYLSTAESIVETATSEDQSIQQVVETLNNVFNALHVD